MWDLWWTYWRWGRFSPSTSVSPTNSHTTNCFLTHHLSSEAGTIGQLVADVPSGLSFTPPHETKKNYLRNYKVQPSVGILLRLAFNGFPFFKNFMARRKKNIAIHFILNLIFTELYILKLMPLI
jgi:hypothetical protein